MSLTLPILCSFAWHDDSGVCFWNFVSAMCLQGHVRCTMGISRNVAGCRLLLGSISIQRGLKGLKGRVACGRNVEFGGKWINKTWFLCLVGFFF